MQTEEIEVNGKTYTVSEIKYKDVTKLSDIPKEESSQKMMELSTGITDEEYDNLSMKDGIKIQKVINKLNGFDDDFQAPLTQ